jgi:hypothetical protein
MAVETIRSAAESMDVTIPIRKLTATRGKAVRAQPVSALSAQGRWHHVGTFESLEDQMCTWTEDSGYSPDRLDAMVWDAHGLKLAHLTGAGKGTFGAGAAGSQPIGNRGGAHRFTPEQLARMEERKALPPGRR